MQYLIPFKYGARCDYDSSAIFILQLKWKSSLVTMKWHNDILKAMSLLYMKPQCFWKTQLDMETLEGEKKQVQS